MARGQAVVAITGEGGEFSEHEQQEVLHVRQLGPPRWRLYTGFNSCSNHLASLSRPTVPPMDAAL
jgi:hypothetical protein